MPRTKKNETIELVNSVVADKLTVKQATPLKTFKVRRVVEYTMTARNEYHAENKVDKLLSDADYASENPVENYSISTVIIETSK
jgi:hypothetical protein